MYIYEITDIIENFAPTSLAEDYDNPGLLVGCSSAQTDTVLTALDVTPAVVCEAAKCGARLILAHHPLIFSPIKSVTDRNYVEYTLSLLLKNGISLYAAHTNLDSAKGGMNDRFCQKLGILNPTPLCALSNDCGIGRQGELSAPMPFSSYLEFIKETFDLPFIKYLGDKSRIIKKVAVCTGSGSSLIPDAANCGADLFITGEIKHSAAFEADYRGLCLAEVSHYDSEILAKDIFYDILSKAFGDKLKIIKSEKDINLFEVLK